MSYPLPGVYVNPNGTTQSVTITDDKGNTPTVYSDPLGQNVVALPKSISSPFTFYLPSPGTWTVAGVTVSLEGSEVATVTYTQSGASANLTVNEQTGTTYTLALTDGNGSTLVECANASPVTLTIPPNSSVAFPVGTVIPVSQGGAGQVVVTAGTGVTLRTPNGAKTAQQWSQAALTQRATNDWIVSGDTSV